MNMLLQAIWVELLKARRSRMPFFSVLGFSLLPFIGGFFMVVLKDPVLARRVGLISAKAQILAGTADWPTYLDLLTQGVAVGGFILFGFIGSWVFGREYADRTVKDLLALPTPRAAVVLAKCVVVFLWTAGLGLFVAVLGAGVGMLVGLPAAPAGTIERGMVVYAATVGMVIALNTPVFFFASAGRGYLPPLGMAVLALFLAQVVAAAGWGAYFPWSIPALYAGMAGPESAALDSVSVVILGAACILGLLGTFLWWEVADQH